MKKVFLTMMVCMLLTGCSQDETTMFGSISGVVKDKITSEALAGVRVTIMPGGDSSVTGTDGNFQFKDLDASDYTISYAKEGYVSDSKKVTVSPGMNRDASVLLEPIVPVLSVSPAKLDFEEETTTLALDIKNTGKGTLQWSLSEDIGWLSCQPDKGTTTNETSSIVVTVSREGLDRGNYNGTIVVSSNGGSQTIQVSMTVEAVKLEVQPKSLDFGASETTIQLALSNAGTGTINYTVASSDTWLTTNKNSGSVTQSDYITAVVSREGLAVGKYDAALTFTVGRDHVVVPVHMEVAAVNLEITPSSLDFGTDKNSLQLVVKKTGMGTVNYTVSSSNKWLTTNKESGSVSQSDQLTVLVSREGLSAGKYEAMLTLNADKEKFSVPVHMEVAPITAPTVAIESASNATYNSVRLRGTVLSVGSSKITRHGFCWSEHSSPTIDDSYTDAGDCTEPKAFESTATNLKYSTFYYVRAYAINEVGMAYSERVLTFSTTAAPTIPEVSTGLTDRITDTSVRIEGSIVALGNVSSIAHYGHVWGKSPQPTIQNGKLTDYGTTTETRSYFSDLTNLEPNTTYYVRAYATNEQGTAYGDDIVFTTQKAAPTVLTAAITDIGVSSAVGGGTVAAANGHTFTEKGVCWNTAGTPTIMDRCAVATADFVCRLTELTASTTYYVRAYVRTAENQVYYGNQQQFTTMAAPANPTNGLFAYYTFENNAKNTVEGAASGQLVNGPTYVGGVQNSTAMKFSASDNSHMIVPAKDMIGGTAFSISFWVKNIGDGHIFHTTRTPGYNDSYGDNATGLYMSNGRLRFIVTGYSTYYEYDHDKYYFSHGAFDSDWHMITLVTTVGTPKYAYAETRLYIDGEYIDSVSEYAGDTSKSYNDTKQFIIGGKLDYQKLKVNAVSMSVDNLRIYNTRALSDAEVKQIYNYEK